MPGRGGVAGTAGVTASGYAGVVNDAQTDHRFELSRGQKAFKAVVYSLLVLNFCAYLVVDINNAAHTLNADSTLLNVTSAFAVSSAVFAWLLLIALLELETYALDDEAWTGRLTLVVHAVRLGCLVVITHWIFALVDYAVDLRAAAPLEGVNDLCALAGEERSWTFNLDYRDITDDNCAELSTATTFFAIPDSPVVTDGEGLALERQLAWGDVVEIVAWLLIILATEALVRLQERQVTGGRLMSALRGTTFVSYGVPIVLALWWLWLGHPLYTWDTFLWIGGFTVIEMNLRAWREEIARQMMVRDAMARPETLESADRSDAVESP
ncbi:MAG: hypothetical protein V2I57_12790 [Xanthomonadales bacterium]|jgi:hypothetical protein|nr:hypothetical protein [Xanthomonadales bacterium]